VADEAVRNNVHKKEKSKKKPFKFVHIGNYKFRRSRISAIKTITE
jgi:hypothetical protein